MIRHPQSTPDLTLSLGACIHGHDQCAFRVWAPAAKTVELHLLTPQDRLIPMTRDDQGYFQVQVEGVPPGSRYFFRLPGNVDRPDPASRSQPEGVHGASAVVDPRQAWHDAAWSGLPLADFILYELHVGTFTPSGTFEAVIPHLTRLKDLGITAIELMPVAQFPGPRNWGYDGVQPFAVQHSYGGPEGLQRLVDAAHQAGLAVVLDVVYNHLGPEGNYLGEFGPYFTDRYKTPWGAALNFDGPESDQVRRYFIENALYWQTHFHIDALRLDAVHAIRDFSAVPFLEELGEVCRHQAEALPRPFYLIAESDMNMARHILPRTRGGYGLDAQWSDDFHHALHVLLTGEQNGYYADYAGIHHLAKVLREGYAYTGQYSRYRRHRHGSSPQQNPAKQFVVCAQNHDQVGNRMLGDRLSSSLSLEQLKLAAGTVLLSPFVPLLFMGEEYGETAPFQYFTSHSDPGLVEAVRRGRRSEFAAFQWQAEVPDPQDPSTFRRSQLNPELAGQPKHRSLLGFYRMLLDLRKSLTPIRRAEKETTTVHSHESEQVLSLRYSSDPDEAWIFLCFAKTQVNLDIAVPDGPWHKRLDSAAPNWNGPGEVAPKVLSQSGSTTLRLNPWSVVVFHNVKGSPRQTD